MINKDSFYHISDMVSESVNKAFETAYWNANIGDFYLFLARTDKNDTETSMKIPYYYESEIDELREQSRVHFLEKYINNCYSSRSFLTEDNDLTLTFELLLYMQMWGEKGFLKKLRRLTTLCEGKSYEWEVDIPKTGMYNFIGHCRTALENNKLDIAKFIHESYLSQIRDATAHDEYYFTGDRIVFTNFKNKPHEIAFEKVDDWTLRFVKTFLLYYHLSKEFEKQKKSLPICQLVPVQLKRPDGACFEGHIEYDGSRFHIITD